MLPRESTTILSKQGRGNTSGKDREGLIFLYGNFLYGWMSDVVNFTQEEEGLIIFFKGVITSKQEPKVSDTQPYRKFLYRSLKNNLCCQGNQQQFLAKKGGETHLGKILKNNLCCQGNQQQFLGCIHSFWSHGELRRKRVRLEQYQAVGLPEHTQSHYIISNTYTYGVTGHKSQTSGPNLGRGC